MVSELGGDVQADQRQHDILHGVAIAAGRRCGERGVAEGRGDGIAEEIGDPVLRRHAHEAGNQYGNVTASSRRCSDTRRNSAKAEP